MEVSKSQLVDVKDFLKGKITPLAPPQPPNKEGAESVATTDSAVEPTKGVEPTSTEEMVLQYFKDKGKNINSVEELFAEPQTKEINPYADILDEQDKAYLEFKKSNPQKTRRDFEAVYSDLDKISPLEFARARVLKETGLNLTNEQIDQYLEEELNVSVSEEELSAVDLVKLSKYGKPIKEERIAEQQLYKEVKTEKQNEARQANQDKEDNSDYVRLDNNTIMLRSDYDKLVVNHQSYLRDNEEAVNGVTASVFRVDLDDNGQKQERVYTYEYDQKDRHSMVSLSSDVQQMVMARYRSDKGFDHKQFNEDLFWI